MTDTMEVLGKQIEISHPDKPYFPDDGITKRDLVAYYARIAETAAPLWQGRAVTMQRFPDGIGAEGFFHKNAPDHFPGWVRRAELPKEGGSVSYAVADHPATLAFLATQGTITPHLSLARVDRPDHPDRMIFDLDPSDRDFGKVRRAARHLKDLFEALDLTAYVQTTGSRGFHVILPLDRSAGFDRVRALARRIADRLAAAEPDSFTTEQRKAGRGDRVFLDTLRNAYGQTGVAPYGVRAKPRAPIATPLDWDEALGRTGPQDYHMGNIFRRLAQKEDPWRGIAQAGVAAETVEARLDALGTEGRDVVG
ncbi:non-homologous end-joining DNA ligase [Rhodovulum sp. YNF3179]|uniref:non-homologous end-joining DNA ligase n=1 Tax=Rhodovulum sp. YNF3179 TaxID=3425127 RepID=UPI003D3362F4